MRSYCHQRAGEPSGLQVVEARFDAADGVWDLGGVFLDENVGSPVCDVGAQRGGAAKDRFFGAAEALAHAVEIDHVDGVLDPFTGQGAEPIVALPFLGKLLVVHGRFREQADAIWLVHSVDSRAG